MIVLVIIFGLLLVAETAFMLFAMRGPVTETKADLMQDNWIEFLNWIEDARDIKSLVDPYETWTEVRKGTPHYVGKANEANFWLWYLDYKWEKPNATIKSGAVK